MDPSDSAQAVSEHEQQRPDLEVRQLIYSENHSVHIPGLSCVLSSLPVISSFSS